MRVKTKGWGPERRKEQAKRCRARQPWLYSTGPRSEKGKGKTRFNAIKHGNRRYVWRELRSVLKRHRDMLSELKLWMDRREKPVKKIRLRPRKARSINLQRPHALPSILSQLMDLQASMCLQGNQTPSPQSCARSVS